MNLDIVIFGLSITSSWGNGHAATYRALAKALYQRGHRVTFVERDVPWYRENRDLHHAEYCRIELYHHLREVPRRFGSLVAGAHMVIVGSYVPDGTTLADWVTRRARGITAFYDIDTPVTLTGLASGKGKYISASLIPRFDLYLSFTGGPLLHVIEEIYGSPRARVLYCAADIVADSETTRIERYALGYLGTYSADRQPTLETLLLEPARRLGRAHFVAAGPKYPGTIRWPANVSRIEHVAPDQHAAFYGSQRFTLNLTRAEMRAAGFSPSVRLFEAAASGVAIISDDWPGLETFFAPGREILIADGTRQIIEFLTQMPDERRRDIAEAGRRRLLHSHTPQHRARQLEDYYQEVISGRRVGARLEVVA